MLKLATVREGIFCAEWRMTNEAFIRQHGSSFPGLTWMVELGAVFGAVVEPRIRRWIMTRG